MRWVRVGVGFRFPIREWIESTPAEIECLEITAEHFYNRDTRLLEKLCLQYPCFIHSIGLSLGSPGGLDRQLLSHLKTLVDIVKPEWISEHIAFTKTADVDLGHLNPIAPTRENLNLMVDHAIELSEETKTPLILENITTYLQLRGDLKETTFINQLCDNANCGLLLDVTNLLVNARNHKFDPISWLKQLNPLHIKQLHIVGYSKTGDSYEDIHADAIQADLFTLLEFVAEYARPQAVIIERDRNFPPVAELSHELHVIKKIFRASNSY